MGMKEIRNARHMSQRELAVQSGINYRSLQDYEQGHKKLSSANGDVLLRLSTVLGCSISDLLHPEHLNGAKIHERNLVSNDMIQSQRLYCEKYHTAGRWICQDGMLSTFFYYEGIPYYLPFRAYFTPKMLFCLREAAALQIESKIDDILDEKQGFESW